MAAVAVVVVVEGAEGSVVEDSAEAVEVDIVVAADTVEDTAAVQE